MRSHLSARTLREQGDDDEGTRSIRNYKLLNRERFLEDHDKAIEYSMQINF